RVEARFAQPGDGGVERVLRDLEGKVDVLAAAAARDADLRPPEADARAVAGHHPDRLPLRPPLHDRQPENAVVETLGGCEILDFEHELAHARDGDGHAASSTRRAR